MTVARKGSCRPGAKPRVGKAGDRKPTRGGRNRRTTRRKR